MAKFKSKSLVQHAKQWDNNEIIFDMFSEVFGGQKVDQDTILGNGWSMRRIGAKGNEVLLINDCQGCEKQAFKEDWVIQVLPDEFIVLKTDAFIVMYSPHE